MKLISDISPAGWYPKPGESVMGMSGKRQVKGTVLAATDHPSKARIFSKFGLVALVVEDQSGIPRAIKEVKPAN